MTINSMHLTSHKATLHFTNKRMAYRGIQIARNCNKKASFENQKGFNDKACLNLKKTKEDLTIMHANC